MVDPKESEVSVLYDPHHKKTCLQGLRPGSEIIKLFSSSAQLSMEFQLLINAEMSKLVENSGSNHQN